MIKSFTYETSSDIEIINITSDIEGFVKSSKSKEGLLNVFVKSTTSALVIMEEEEGIKKDLLEALENLAPKNKKYAHDSAWGDANGFAHLRAELLGQSLFIPIKNSALDLGTWQNIFLIDFDNKARKREVVASTLNI